MTDETRRELEDIATTLIALEMRVQGLMEELGTGAEEPVIEWVGVGDNEVNLGDWTPAPGERSIAFAHDSGHWEVHLHGDTIDHGNTSGGLATPCEAAERAVRAYLAAQADTLTAAEVASEQDVSAAGEDALRDEAQRECWLEKKTSSSGVL